MDTTPVDPQFVLEHAAHVRALASRLVFDGTRAEDLEQETWLAALKNAPSSMTSPRGWLARIAQRRVVHDWRSEMRREAREHSVARAESVASSEEILEREEKRTVLVRAVLALDEPYRSALVAQFLEERTPSAAASTRGVPLETQRTHVKRALDLLRERLKRDRGAAFGALQLALVRDLRTEAPFATTLAAAGSGLVIGGLSMWTAKKVALAAALVLVLVLGATRPWQAVGPPNVAQPTTDRSAVLVDPSVVALSIEPAVGRIAADAKADDGAGTTPRPSSSAAIVVLARIVDELGVPIAGARGDLRATRETWNATTSRDAVFGAVSAADGSLRIEAPPISTNAARLAVSDTPYRARVEVRFEPAELRILGPGTTDVGTIVLRPAGRVVGRAVHDGIALPGVDVEARSSDWWASKPSAQTDEHGRFVLDGVDPSAAELALALEGFVAATARIAVVPGADVDVGDLALERAPFVAGRVVDRDNRPLAKVLIAARSVFGSREGSARSNPDGSFRVHVPIAGDYDLSVAGGSQFLAWGGAGAPGARFATGEANARIVLDPVPMTTFRVVAADTLEPVREFGLGLRLLPQADRSLGGFDTTGNPVDGAWPRVVARATNEVAERALPELHEVFVASPDFMPLRARVVHDVEGVAVQTLRLERGRTLRGRVVREGIGIAGAQVDVEYTLVPLGPAPDPPGSIEVGRTHDWDLDSFTGRARTVVTDERGDFEFRHVAAGTYVLGIALDGRIAMRIDPVAIASDADRDLGAIEVRRGAIVRGVLDAGAASPIGWRVQVGKSPSIGIDRRDGRFELRGVPSGPVDLRWHCSALGLDDGTFDDDGERSLHLDLREGEDREVRLDAVGLAPARVTVRVRADGKAEREAMLHLTMRRSDGQTLDSAGGPTGADGAWTGSFRPGTSLEIVATMANGLPLACSPAIVLAAGEEREVVLEARTGLVEIALPEDVDMPAPACVRISIHPRGSLPWVLGIGQWCRDPVVGIDTKGAWNGRRVPLGRVGEGEWTIEVQVIRLTPTDASPRNWEYSRPYLQREITVRPGETTVVEIP